MEQSLARSLFTPRTIALIGASEDLKKASSRPQRFLKKQHFTGRVLPINPSRREVFGERAYASLQEAPGPIDHAFIMVPAAIVPMVVAECCAAKVPVATIMTDGFAETGAEGRTIQDAMVATARAAGLRLVGPNSMGLVDTYSQTALTASDVLAGLALEKGSLALVSQSGGVLGALMSRAQARGQAFSRLVSTGNEADISVGELVDLLIDDDNTRVILLFLETLRDPESLARAARRAHAANKPIVAYKLGTSEIGRALATSHTGAMVGPKENAEAFFRDSGILHVKCLESLWEIAPLIAGRRPPIGRRVAIMTTTAGSAAMVADRLGALDAELVPATEELRQRIATFGIRVGEGPIADLTMAGSRKDVYAAGLEALVAADNCDARVAVVGASGMFRPELFVDSLVAAAGADKPLAVFAAPEAQELLRQLAARNVAAFRTPEACADSVDAYLRWRAPRDLSQVAVLNAVERMLEGKLGRQFNESDASSIVAALGIPAPRSWQLREGDVIPDLEFPVVAKILSADIAHKSEVGGVVVGLHDRQALERAIATIPEQVRMRHPQARIEGIIVQEMVRGLAEAIVGYRLDPEVGPIVMVGAGGTLAEIYHDLAVRLAPVDEATALEMVAEVRGLAVIRGYRNLPRGDCEALAQAIVALSSLAALSKPRVLEAEVNPIQVKSEGEGVVALDCLLVTDRS